jgi:glycosyltransferase involved in cell wall biosynthesis
MRVLFVQKMAGIAGAETYYLKLLPVLRNFGVEPSFLVVEASVDSGRNDPFVEELAASGVRVERLTSNRAASWTLLRRIARFVESGRFDLVQSNLIHADVWLAAIKRVFLPKMKLVSLKHGYSEGYQLQHGFDPEHLRLDRFSVLTRLAATQADRVVAISHGLAKLLSDGGLVPASKLSVIPYGFSFEDAISAIPPGGARTGNPQIVTVGRLVPVKQHGLLIRTLPGLAKRFPQVKLVIIGSGPEEERLRGIAEELGVSEYIEWTGFVRNIHDYLRDSDLFVFPSRAEGFGAVTLEAWYNQLPVIAFDVPAQNEIITDGVDGFLVEPFVAERLEKCIFRLLDNPELRRKVGSTGRVTYETRYTVDAMVGNTVDLYSSVVEDPENEREGSCNTSRPLSETSPKTG